MEMRKFTKGLFFSAATVALLTMAACSSDDDNLTQETSRIEIRDFAVSVAEGDSTLQFYAAANWSATLSASSWISIDPMTKVGSKGDAKVILNWKASTDTKEKTADLTIAVDGENPVKIRIVQFSNEPILLFDKEALSLEINQLAANGRGQFCDTLTVQSNIAWEVKEIPTWVSYSFLDNKQSQEGVPTTVRMVLAGDPAKYTQAEMVGNVKIGGVQSVTTEQEVGIKAVSYLCAEHPQNPGTAVTKLTMEKSAAAGNRFISQINVKSNTRWAILNQPEWAFVSLENNYDDYAKTLITEKTVAFVLKEGYVDTDKMSQKIALQDTQTGITQEIELVFPGLDETYFEASININPDFYFGATYAEGGVLEMDFEMTTARDYTTLAEAPYEFFFVRFQSGWTYKEEIYWAGVELQPSLQRAAPTTKKLTLWVSDRSYDFMKNQARSCYMVIAPKGTVFDDLFIEGTEDLKEEYLLAAYLVNQKAVKQAGPETNLPEVFEFSGEGGKSEVFEAKNFEMLSFTVNGNSIAMPAEWGNWAEIDFTRDDNDKVNGVYVTAKPNETGKERSVVVNVTLWDEKTGEEVPFMNITIYQAAQ